MRQNEVKMKEVTKEKIIKIISSTIKNIQITPEQYDQDLQKLGMDSIKFIHTIVLLEKEFECEIPDEKLLMSEMGTIGKIMSVLQELYNESDK